jgi:hypothetical protein
LRAWNGLCRMIRSEHCAFHRHRQACPLDDRFFFGLSLQAACHTVALLLVCDRVASFKSIGEQAS